MGQEIAITQPQHLKLYEPPRFSFDKTEPKTPNEWFGQRYPEAYQNHGSPFLELVQPIDQFTAQVLPITINPDFFASVLGGRKDLGHHVIYFEPEMQWYFLDWDGLYKPTTAEKLMNLYRALLMKCCEEMPGNVHKLNLVHEWRGDRTSKLIVQRAKSILAASSEFFSATSPNQRIRGLEIMERVARKFVDELLESGPGQVLRLTDAFEAFRRLLKERELPDIKRSDFKAVVGPLIRNEFCVALRNDLIGDGVSGVRGWKGVKLIQSVPG